jgi:hypothetical protein
MDNMFFWVIVLVGVSIISSLVWYGLLLFGILKGAKYLNQQFEQQLRSTEAMHQQWAQMSPQERMEKTAQMAQALSKLNQGLAQLDDIGRQRYETRVGEMMGTVSRTGINWHP